MRQTFLKTLVECAEKDSRIYLLVADIGFGLVNSFFEKFPSRFINVGVAEQNMIGIATGLALSGKIVFCYSIANFPTLRCLEQIRNDVCCHDANVCIVAGSTGLTYGELGSSHHATEDISIMRSLPNMTVIAPGDTVETKLATEAIAKGIGGCYLRLGKSVEPTIHKTTPVFEIGKTLTVVSGNGVAIISTGSMLYNSMQAVRKLSSVGINPAVLSMHTVKPIDVETIILLSRVVHTIVTVEEHSIIGGLGSAIAEVIADYNLHVKLKRMGLDDSFCTQVGTQAKLLEDNGLTIGDIVREVEDAFC